MINDEEATSLVAAKPGEEPKVLSSWLIYNAGTGKKRVVHQQPTRWRPQAGRLPHRHEVDWDESVYKLHAELVAPEVIDGKLEATFDGETQPWEEKPESDLSMEAWIAQEIFRRSRNLVPPNAFGPAIPMTSIYQGDSVVLKLTDLGTFCIKVERTS